MDKRQHQRTKSADWKLKQIGRWTLQPRRISRLDPQAGWKQPQHVI
jgi:hypothetical protein